MHEQYRDGDYFDFPDPASLTAEQIEDLYRRINATTETSDGPILGMQDFAWMIMMDLGLIRDKRTR